MNAKLLWSPFPYKAGICITDDTDAATFGQVKSVYDYLLLKKDHILSSCSEYMNKKPFTCLLVGR